MPAALLGGFLTTEPPGKTRSFKKIHLSFSSAWLRPCKEGRWDREGEDEESLLGRGADPEHKEVFGGKQKHINEKNNHTCSQLASSPDKPGELSKGS